MRKVLVLIALISMFILTSCPREIEDTGIRRYQNTENIINPPDSFLLLMPMVNNYSVKAFMETEENAVWRVVKENAVTSTVWMTRALNDPDLYYLNTIDTIGLESGISYEIYGNNNNYSQERTLQLRFDKTAIDYETFPKKL